MISGLDQIKQSEIANELQAVRTLEKKLTAKKVARWDEKTVWVEDETIGTVSYPGSRYGTYDVEVDDFETIPAHWSKERKPIYEPDLEERGQARKELEEIHNTSKFYSVKYRSLPTLVKKRDQLREYISELEKNFEVADAMKLFEVSEHLDSKRLLVKQSESNEDPSLRDSLKEYLDKHFHTYKLRNQHKYQDRCANLGLLAGVLAPCVGAAIGAYYSPEFKEFITSHTIPKMIGTIVLSVGVLGVKGVSYGDKLDEKRADRKYKEWLRE